VPSWPAASTALHRAGRDGLIVTADDFGAARAVNEAVEHGYRQGILTATSLMIGGDAARDAVERARRLPGLGIGLHIVLTDARPLLPPERLPALVGADGRFHRSMLRTALIIASSSAARSQLRSEIEAQFAAFSATGLLLDHVNTHKHFHLHPMIVSAILSIGARYGMRAMRVPVERSSPRLLRWWAGLLARRLRRSGILVNDYVIGLAWSGAFDAARMHQAVSSLPPGLTEIYCHPATADHYPGHAPGYRYREELAALLDGETRRRVEAAGVECGTFLDFVAADPLNAPAGVAGRAPLEC
jgi:hopanoid biosynthesis associated protein HpnK